MMKIIGKLLKDKFKQNNKSNSIIDENKKKIQKLSKIAILSSSMTLSPLIITVLLIVIIIAAPVFLISEFKEMIKNNEVNLFFERVENAITFNGWCADSNGECEKQAEQDFYDEIEKMEKKYNNIDTELITATIFYGYNNTDYLFRTNSDGQNETFIKYFCEANSIGWAGQKGCELYIKLNYDDVYEKQKDTYLKVATNYDRLRQGNCEGKKDLISSLTYLGPLSSLPIDYHINTPIDEACEFFLWNFADLSQVVFDDNSIVNIYRGGKDDIGTLASNMVSGNKLDYTKYRNYLIDTYIPKRFSDMYNDSDKDNAIERIADEIMAFASLEDGMGSGEFAGNCSFNEQEQVKVNADRNYIDNIQINTLYPYYHNYYTENATSKDIEYTVSLKEYVTGVVYREIHAGINPMSNETIKANLVAIKSYTLGRRSAIEKNGKYYITMRNNTDDQVYCNLDKGCRHYSSYGESNLLDPAPANVKELLYRLYDETIDDYVYNTATNKFIGAYTDTKGTCVRIGAPTNCMSQTDSITMGNNGNDYKAILISFYNDNAGLLNLNESTVSTGAYACSQTTYMGGGKYSSNAPRYDNSGDFFANLNYNYFQSASSMNDPWNIGQCPWYARGRSIEIMANSNIPDELKQARINFIRNMSGNGEAWFRNPSDQLFSKSTDIYAAKPGSIVSWSGGSTACSPRCGHVGIVEDVEYDSNGKATKVLLTDSWNRGRVLGTTGYAYRWMSIEQLRVYNLANPNYYSGFNGYVYLLD